jgi:hypothetical protein
MALLEPPLSCTHPLPPLRAKERQQGDVPCQPPVEDEVAMLRQYW